MTTPLALDFAHLPVALAGAGPALLKRLALLDGERVTNLAVYAPDPEPTLRAACGARLVERLPTEADIAALRVLFVAGLPPEQSLALATLARGHRVLVNVEDVLPLCDFHVPAILRRGDLAVSISTGGKSPAAARRLRAWLDRALPAAWDERLARLGAERERLRAQGARPAEIAAATNALIDTEGWLPPA